MRRLFLLLILAPLLALPTSPPAAVHAQSGAPKLVVILVVDQMRADYLRTFERHWRAGFRTLLAEGAVMQNAHYAHLLTVTCPGHATIGTGTYPRTHGMISNTWWHRDTRTSPECTADAATPAVTYGASVTTGSSPHRLLVPTLADELRAQKPGARVVAMSLKSRGAITLAGRAADAIVWFEDAAATFATSRAYSAAPVPAVKRFIDGNPVEKEYGRSWTLLDAPETYLHPDAGVGERPVGNWTGLFPHVISVPTPPAARGRGDGRGEGRGEGRGDGRSDGRGATPAPATPPPPTITAAQAAAQWQASPYADRYLGRMAAALAENFQLGRRDATDFLSVSFSSLDDVGHAFGPGSREVEDLLRQLDVTIGQLIAALDAQVGRANYVLALSADHGVAPFAAHGTAGRVHTEDIRDRIEDRLVTAWGRPQKGTYVDASQTGYVYLAPGVFERLAASPATMAAVERDVESIPGVVQLLRTDQLSESSRDRMARAAWFTHVPGRGGELLVVAREGWSVGARTVFSANHGTPHAHDSHVPMIFFGAGIRAQRSGSAVTPADIAPTLAQLIGIRMGRAEGRVVREALALQ